MKQINGKQGKKIFSIFCFLFSIFCFLSPLFSLEAKTPVFDKERAFKRLIKQCEFGPRPVGSIAHEKLKSYLISELKKSAIKVSSQSFTVKDKNSKPEPKEMQLTNIIAEFETSEGSGSGKEKLLLGAHWDTRPFSDRDLDPKRRSLPILGANDGASGVAVLLEIAQIIGENPPNIKIVVAFFDGEDYGQDEEMMFLGSKYFAKNMDSWRPDNGIIVDMVGDKDLSLPIEETSFLAAPSLVKDLWKRAERLGLSAFKPKVRSAILDDHTPLINSGIPCIVIIDLDYPYWHSRQDTVDKCSPKSLETVGKLLLNYIYER